MSRYHDIKTKVRNGSAFLTGIGSVLDMGVDLRTEITLGEIDPEILDMEALISDIDTISKDILEALKISVGDRLPDGVSIATTNVPSPQTVPPTVDPLLKRMIFGFEKECRSGSKINHTSGK